MSWAVDDDDLLLGLTVLRPSISNLLQSVSSVIIKCDGLLSEKVRQLLYSKLRQFYYKVRRLLPSATEQRESFWNLESVGIQPAEISGEGTDFLHDYQEFSITLIERGYTTSTIEDRSSTLTNATNSTSLKEEHVHRCSILQETLKK